MELSIKNIGKIESADIQLDGITVICGENNTGKSTVGKVLFCVFNSCYNMDSNISSQINFKLMYNIELIIRNAARNKIFHNSESTVDVINEKLFDFNSKEFIKFITCLSDNKEIGVKQVLDFLSIHLNSYFKGSIIELYEVSEKIYDIINETKNLPIEPFQKSIVKNHFNIVFSNQIININNEEANILMKIKNNTFKVKFHKTKNIDLLFNFDFTNHAIFIDSPYKYKVNIMDWNETNQYSRNTLNDLAESYFKNENSESIDIDRTIRESKLAQVIEVLNKAIKGRFKQDSLRMGRDIGFEFEGFSSPINTPNLSTGVKALLLFRTICESGKLSEKDVLILDEPEIHIHPEWQLIYAEAIVLLQKEFDLTVLITTHSPYFLEAIEVYGKKHSREKVLNYYLAENTLNGYSIMEDVTGKLNKIYEKMYNPFKCLEEEEI